MVKTVKTPKTSKKEALLLSLAQAWAKKGAKVYYRGVRLTA